MDSREAIIKRITMLSEKAVAKVLSDAQSECDTAQEEARADIQEQKNAALERAMQKANDIKTRRELLFSINEKKQELKAKQDLISEVYTVALGKLKAMPRDEYKEFVSRLILRYAENNDEIIVYHKDKRLFHQEWLDSLIKDTGLNLTLSSQTHSDEGGVILRGEIYDKLLTLKAIITDAREKTEMAVIEALFD